MDVFMFAKFKAKIKSLHLSSTNWFNVAGAAYLETLLAYPELTFWLTSKDLFYVVIVGNIILRVFKTSQAIEEKA